MLHAGAMVFTFYYWRIHINAVVIPICWMPLMLQLKWVISVVPVWSYNFRLSGFVTELNHYSVLAYPTEFQVFKCGVIWICFLLIISIHSLFHTYVVSLTMKCVLSWSDSFKCQNIYQYLITILPCLYVFCSASK
jgi:hypothetical protein